MLKPWFFHFQTKVLENLEVFVVTQLDMLNMDVPVLWKINEHITQFSITDFIDRVYFPQLSLSLEKVINCFENSADHTQSSTLLLPVANMTRRDGISSMDDIRFIAKAFVMLSNWEDEVKEIVDFFAIKPERRFSGV